MKKLDCPICHVFMEPSAFKVKPFGFPRAWQCPICESVFIPSLNSKKAKWIIGELGLKQKKGQFT